MATFLGFSSQMWLTLLMLNLGVFCLTFFPLQSYLHDQLGLALGYHFSTFAAFNQQFGSKIRCIVLWVSLQTLVPVILIVFLYLSCEIRVESRDMWSLVCKVCRYLVPSPEKRSAEQTVPTSESELALQKHTPKAHPPLRSRRSIDELAETRSQTTLSSPTPGPAPFQENGETLLRRPDASNDFLDSSHRKTEGERIVQDIYKSADTSSTVQTYSELERPVALDLGRDTEGTNILERSRQPNMTLTPHLTIQPFNADFSAPFSSTGIREEPGSHAWNTTSPTQRKSTTSSPAGHVRRTSQGGSLSNVEKQEVAKESLKGSPSPPSTARGLSSTHPHNRRSTPQEIERMRQDMHQRLNQVFIKNGSSADESIVADLEIILDNARYYTTPSNDANMRMALNSWEQSYDDDKRVKVLEKGIPLTLYTNLYLWPQAWMKVQRCLKLPAHLPRSFPKDYQRCIVEEMEPSVVSNSDDTTRGSECRSYFYAESLVSTK